MRAHTGGCCWIEILVSHFTLRLRLGDGSVNTHTRTSSDSYRWRRRRSRPARGHAYGGNSAAEARPRRVHGTSCSEELACRGVAAASTRRRRRRPRRRLRSCEAPSRGDERGRSAAASAAKLTTARRAAWTGGGGGAVGHRLPVQALFLADSRRRRRTSDLRNIARTRLCELARGVALRKRGPRPPPRRCGGRRVRFCVPGDRRAASAAKAAYVAMRAPSLAWISVACVLTASIWNLNGRPPGLPTARRRQARTCV